MPIRMGRNIRATSGSVRAAASHGRRMMTPHAPPVTYCSISHASDLQERFCGLRKCDVEVGRGEQFAAPCLDPAFASARLTLRAMAIAATVIRDGGTMSATGALIDVTAECGGATARNREQDLDMGPADPRSVALNESSSCTAN